MNLNDKKEWLFKHGRVTQSGWGHNSTKLKWEPKGHPASYVESCFGGNRDKVYGSLFDNIKEALFLECGIIDGH